jgi:hypothetical protein
VAPALFPVIPTLDFAFLNCNKYLDSQSAKA